MVSVRVRARVRTRVRTRVRVGVRFWCCCDWRLRSSFLKNG